MKLAARSIAGKFIRSRRGAITISAIAASLAAGVALTFASWSAAALQANLRIDPSTQTLAPGSDFSISLTENADVDLSGVQADIQFDPSRFQIVSLDKGTDWGTASMFVGGPTPDGHPQTAAEAIAEANTTGILRGLARFKSPGNGRISPGPKVAAIIHMHALAEAANGQTVVTLSSLHATDGAFNEIPTSKTNGAIIVDSAATATSTSTPTPAATTTGTVTPTPGAGDTATATSTGTAGPGATATATATATETAGPGLPGTIRVTPATQSVQHGNGFTVTVKHNVDTTTVGVLADVVFDPALVQVVDVQPGASYLGADMTLGTPPQTNAGAIAAANESGTLKVLFYLSDGTVPPGDAEAFKVNMQARLNVAGVSPIQLKNVTVYGGVEISVTRMDGLVEVIGPARATATATATATSTATSVATAVTTNTATSTAVTPPTATSTMQPTATATRTVTPAPTVTVAAVSTSTPPVVPTNTTMPTSTFTAGAGTSTATSAAGTATVPATSTATKTVILGSPTAKPTVDPNTAQATISTTPPTVTVPPGAEFTLILVQQAGFVTTGAQTDVKFDPKLLQVVSVEKSQAYSKASLLAGVAPQKLPDAIVEANTSGTLKNIATFFVPGSGKIDSGPSEFVRIKLQAKSDASNTTTAVKLSDLEMLNESGEPVTVAGKDAQITIQVGAPVPTPPGVGSTVAGASVSPGKTASKLPTAGVSQPFGQLNWALTISLIAMLASGAALVGSLARKDSQEER